jgi:hypothetical protein
MGSDWGTQAWAEDVGAAYTQAAGWIGKVAAARGWSGDWQKLAYQLATNASRSGKTPIAFWGALKELWQAAEEDAVAGVPDGWSKLGKTWAAAAGASYQVSKGREAGSWTTIAGGTISGSVEDVKAGVDWWGRHGKKVLLGAAAVGAAKLLGVF